jgi:hypothetical protein
VTTTRELEDGRKGWRGVALAAALVPLWANQAPAAEPPPGLRQTPRSGQAAAWQRPSEAGQKVPEGDLQTLTLVQSTDGRAVVRFGSGPLEVVTVADRLGKNKAEVKEISAGRMVLDETFTGQDGHPNRAQIVIKDGETGGKRYLLRNDEPPVRAVRPQIVVPTREPVKKPPAAKKPPDTKKPPGPAR